MSASSTAPSWEAAGEEAQRLRVPCGWLYRAWTRLVPSCVGGIALEGWGQPVFVPEPAKQVKP